MIHTVGPVWRGGTADEDALLERCYRRSMEEAADLGATSIAFPAISTGVYGFPADRAAAIAVATVLDELERPGRPPQVVLCAFGDSSAEVLQRALTDAT